MDLFSPTINSQKYLSISVTYFFLVGPRPERMENTSSDTNKQTICLNISAVGPI